MITRSRRGRGKGGGGGGGGGGNIRQLEGLEFPTSVDRRGLSCTG